MRRTHRRAGILLAALPLCTLLLVHAAPRAEAAARPPHCAVGALPVHPAGPGQDAQGVLVALQPDVAPRSGGTQVVLNGSGLTPYTRVLFGSLAPDGCFTGLEATGVTVISDSSVIATAPQWPTAGTVSVVAATPCGLLTNQLSFTYVD
ncbi:IPT/TIG domain-containing protein [Streptomyces sp. NBC_01264]|uniref:IPT/TIG domain-containing protein n=1 Tax=Streptomyces sp. NBC_01264 TaxID=2903804 RepID=UPI00225B47FF|nr:IPT/TIG domain-containing protein [Streptomyces sp. NBC_01264]MCX4776356.1 IPT/TIG domain-containing protein [Streptomyces sp. NBC_01264]